MYQILQKFDIHWHDGGPSIAMMCHLRRVSDLLYNWKSCLLCYMKDVVLHCSIFFKWNKLVRVRVRVRVHCHQHFDQLSSCDLVLRMDKLTIVCRLSLVDWGCHNAVSCVVDCVVDFHQDSMPLLQPLLSLVVSGLSLWPPIVISFS